MLNQFITSFHDLTETGSIVADIAGWLLVTMFFIAVFVVVFMVAIIVIWLVRATIFGNKNKTRVGVLDTNNCQTVQVDGSLLAITIGTSSVMPGTPDCTHVSIVDVCVPACTTSDGGGICL